MLRTDCKGLGFGCGTEPLPCLFAGMGASIVASDADGFLNLGRLEGSFLVTTEQVKGMEWMTIDMRSIPSSLHGQFDFVWSTSSLEHLGSIEKANRFIVESLNCLKPGGVAVHVTEYAIFPENAADEGGTVFYTKQRLLDLLVFIELLDVDMDFNLGSEPPDYYVDVFPYKGAAHLKLLVDGFVTTSLGLIITK
jgi:SAM-dependent methyltransferase